MMERWYFRASDGIIEVGTGTPAEHHAARVAFEAAAGLRGAVLAGEEVGDSATYWPVLQVPWSALEALPAGARAVILAALGLTE